MKQASILLLLIGLFLSQAAQQHEPQASKTILAIFAHPDDKSAIGDVLTKYARLGNKVQVIIATQSSTHKTLSDSSDFHFSNRES